jgi:hypothetical protein
MPATVSLRGFPPHHQDVSLDVARRHSMEGSMASETDVVAYTLKQAVAVKVEDHIEIAIEAEDGTRIKIKAAADQIDALVGDLETILSEDDAETEVA